MWDGCCRGEGSVEGNVSAACGCLVFENGDVEGDEGGELGVVRIGGGNDMVEDISMVTGKKKKG